MKDRLLKNLRRLGHTHVEILIPEEFNMNRIYRETEIIILHEIAIFYKLLGKLDKACVFYENLIKYFERADMVNDTKPIYLIYIGYSNILGVMENMRKVWKFALKQ